MEKDGVLAIECQAVTKNYGSARGVFDLDLGVRRGEVFGFIGQNGAGKTTTIRLLMDLVRPDHGTVRVSGLDAHRDSLAIKRRVGYLPGELAQFPGVRAAYVVGLLAGLRGGVKPERIAALAKRFDIDLRRKYDELSHGNKQKVALIQAFMHEPEVLILDEPTLGLDPLMQREFRMLVRESAAAGATVFLSSHVLSEVEQICDRVGLIKRGRLLQVGSLGELRAVRAHRVEARFSGEVRAEAIASLPGVSAAAVDDHHVTCTVEGPIAPLLHTLEDAGVVELDSHEMTLEEVFFAHIGEPEPAAADR
ncbi:MAG TPA: ABC transporter ATP-binding protein [Candidatus Dormibacteraeota bacterium]|nr:ABC transporter ATP-binding protein [Candidatus Dormibacteraeota bacterium]